MVLDTNVKRYKFSKLNKILCVLLCLLTFLCGSWLSIITAVAIGVNNKYEQGYQTNDWTNSTAFYKLVVDNVVQQSHSVTEKEDFEADKKLILAQKEKYINEAYSNALILHHKVENYKSVDADEENTQTTTMVEDAYDSVSEQYYIVFDGVEIGLFDLNQSSTKEKLEKEFDENLDMYVSNYQDEKYYCRPRYSVDCDFAFVYKDKLVVKGNKKFDEKSFYNSPYYIVFKNGKTESKGINKVVVEDVIGKLKNQSDSFEKLDFYFATTPEARNLNQMISGFIKNDKCDFSLNYSYFMYTKNTVENPVKNIILAVMFLISSFIFGFLYFSITGKNKKEENAKLVFYDHIPLEISMGIVGAIGFGALVLVVDHGTIYNYMAAAFVAFAIAVLYWILLFVFSASVSRYIKSENKFYKHLLTYWIGKLFASGFAWISKQTKSVLMLLAYKPKKFKRNVIIISLLWFVINFCIMIVSSCLILGNNVITAFVFGLLLAIFDFFVIKKVVQYVSNLDKIIDSASRHEGFTFDIDSLDQSLKILAESMRYTNAELQNAINKAVKDERLRAELITNVSHDLKTPLTSIINYVDLLSKCEIKDKKALEYIGVLDDKGHKLKRLIDDLIEASKVTSGNISVNLSPMDLSELCLQATVDVQAEFDKAGLELVIKQGQKSTVVVADGVKANRVVENLLSNARKYSAKGSRVYVDVYEENGYGVFEIKNISAQPLDITPDELTERFVRGDKSRNQEGNGLGLSIAKELCKIQNGKLEISIDGDLFKAKVRLPK